MDRYYERFFIQKYAETPTGFPPPFDFEGAWRDGIGFMGLFVLNTSNEMMVASAMGASTRGRFATSTDVELKDGDVVRRQRDDICILIIGDPKQSPAQAVSQFKTFTAEITERKR